jgi:hypothetical protein
MSSWRPAASFASRLSSFARSAGEVDAAAWYSRVCSSRGSPAFEHAPSARAHRGPGQSSSTALDAHHPVDVAARSAGIAPAVRAARRLATAARSVIGVSALHGLEHALLFEISIRRSVAQRIIALAFVEPASAFSA